MDRAPIRDYDTGPALRFPNQGQFHPTKYFAGLVQAIEAAGGRIHGGTHAEDFEGGEPARVRTAGGHTITARALVVATNSPVNDRVVIHTKQAPYRTYVVGGAGAGGRRDARALLGHRRPVSLRPAAARGRRRRTC